MKWCRDLYIGDSITHRKNKIKWKIDHNAGTPGIYVIAYASNPKELLDVIPTWVLMQKTYPWKDKEIIGLAKGKKEAFELVRRIIDETYRNTGAFDVRSYIGAARRRDA